MLEIGGRDEQGGLFLGKKEERENGWTYRSEGETFEWPSIETLL